MPRGLIGSVSITGTHCSKWDGHVHPWPRPTRGDAPFCTRTTNKRSVPAESAPLPRRRRSVRNSHKSPVRPPETIHNSVYLTDSRIHTQPRPAYRYANPAPKYTDCPSNKNVRSSNLNGVGHATNPSSSNTTVLQTHTNPTCQASVVCIYIQVGFHGDHYRSSSNRISITIGGHHGRDAWSANLSVWLWSVDCIVFFDKFDSMHRSGSLAPLYAIIYMVVLAQRIRKQEVIINGY